MKENFNLPINTLKRQTSIQNLITFQNWDENLIDYNYYDLQYDPRIHRNIVRVKFFITGFAYQKDQPTIQYVGQWVELEVGQFYYNNNFGFMVGVGIKGDQYQSWIRFSLNGIPNAPCSIWIEKIVLEDSEFDGTGWLEDPDFVSVVVPRPPYVDYPYTPIPFKDQANNSYMPFA